MTRYFIIGLLFSYVTLTAQNIGSIEGVINDLGMKETLPFASVKLLKEDSLEVFQVSTTNFDGEYSFSDIPVGTYSIRTTYVGYPDLLLTNILISEERSKLFIDLEYPEDVQVVIAATVSQERLIKIEHHIPIIEEDAPKRGVILGVKDIKKMNTRSVRRITAPMYSPPPYHEERKKRKKKFFWMKAMSKNHSKPLDNSP